MRRFYLTGLWEAGERLRCGLWPQRDRYPHRTNTVEREDGEFKDLTFFSRYSYRGQHFCFFFFFFLFLTRLPILHQDPASILHLVAETLDQQDSSIPGGGGKKRVVV